MEIERQRIQELIEQQIRSSIHKMGSSFPGIKLSRDAAEAARKSLDLVVDAYSRGAVSIIELIDSQNAANFAELGAEVAVYTFLIDFMATQRATGNPHFFLADIARDEWFKRLEAYYNSAEDINF